MTNSTHLPGKFVWFEHVSNDHKKAQAFLGEVFGWKVEASSMGAFTYEMIKTPEGTIGGYATAKSGEPPHWTAYISVDDVDAAARRVTAAGGTVHGAPFDIPTVGRTARCADPTGARFELFSSARGDAPDAPVRPVGHVDWNELVSTDPERAATFYAEALGYTVETMEMPNAVYRILNQGGVPRAGIMKTPVPQLPSHWVQYVVVDDADAAAARATRAGGRVAMPPMEVPDIGRFGVIIDPLGAPIGVIKPAAR